MKLSTREWHFCRVMRCKNLKDSRYVGVPRECTLGECLYPDKRKTLKELTEKFKGGVR